MNQDKPDTLAQSERLKVITSESILNRAINLVSPGKADILLDIGKHAGAIGFAFAKNVAKVVIIDDRYKDFEIKKKSDALGLLNIEIIAPFDLEQRLPFNNDYFDIVTCRAIINQIRNTDKFLNEIWRVLKPEGKLNLWLPIFSETIKEYWTLLTNVVRADNERDFTYFEIMEVLSRAGFEIVSMIPFAVPRYLSEKISIIKDETTRKRIENLFLSNKERFRELNFRWIDDPKEPSKAGWWHDFNTLEILATKKINKNNHV